MDETQEGKDRQQRFLQVVKERAEEVKREYAGVTLINDPEIVTPIKQERNDTSGRTCLIAVTRNIMKAYGVEHIPTEQEVADEINKSEPFTIEGELRLMSALNFLKTRGLGHTEARLWAYPKELVRGLLDGNAVIGIVPSREERNHAKLLYGIRIADGNILVREYDPDLRAPASQLVTLDQHVQEFYGTDRNTSSSLTLVPEPS